MIQLANLRTEIIEGTQLGRLSRSGELLRDRYEVCKLLGRGGFGVTFLARNVRLPASPVCVIKQLCPNAHDPAALARSRRRFEQEAKTLSQLGSHSQIPQLIDYFAIDGEFYLVQEYVRGQTLAQNVRRCGTWSEAAVKQFLQEFLPVLSYVHQRRVIHRDIKPSNILRSSIDDRLVLIDFGAVKEQIVDPIARSTSTNFVGTIGFAPPEQLAMHPVFSSDLYALGVTCLYLLSGKPPTEFDYNPFTGELQWRNSVQVSEYFGRVLDKLLKLTPPERFKSADEVLRILALEGHLDSLRSCMSNHPMAIAREPKPQHEFVSPMTRTAIAIRDWQARRAAKPDSGNRAR